ncbi:hypothetical protein [Bacillus sp. USDA818B3_A]|uniref:hypothetical protein n=1 Tax=Bacillus sp. USDA818B3_A TaxID=2698834 RepID=UPI0013693C8F|nr:hypothetical protein [Bacillus sp. USDA818B3_A]
MRFSIRFFLAAILLLALAACSNDTATNESSDDKTNVQASETKEKKKEAPLDITGYWSGDGKGDYYSLSKTDDTYSLTSLTFQETIQLDATNVRDNEINTTVVKGTDNGVQTGDKVNLKIINNNKFSLEIDGDTQEFTRAKDEKNVDPLDLVGNWMDDNNYITITKDNNVLTFSFEDGADEGLVKFDISAEVTDVIDNYVFGKITKILPEKYANGEDDDLYLGAGTAFHLSDDKTKLSIMGEQEMTKTDMSFEEFKAQHNNNE